jgi:hypothetical protein
MTEGESGDISDDEDEGDAADDDDEGVCGDWGIPPVDALAPRFG